MKTLTKSDLINLIDRPKPTQVNIPEWNSTVYVRRLNALDRLKLEAIHDSKPVDLTIRTAAMFMSSEDGKPFFDSLEEGLEVLGGKDPQAIQRITIAGYEANVIDLDLAVVKKK